VLLAAPGQLQRSAPFELSQTKEDKRMGYASYLEDIVQRLNSDLGKIKTEINAKKAASEKQRDYVRALLNQCERTLTQLLNLVTDPELDTTFGALELKEEIKKLTEKVKSRDAKVRRLNRELSEMEGELIEARRSNKKLKKDLDFAQNPGKFYDQYSTPEQIRKLKPNR
jgi:small-conductance mechanosensitive channel